MRKLQIRDAEVMKIAIQQEIGRSEESRYDHRLHGVLLVANGQSCHGVAELFGEDATTVQRWVRRFEQRGFEWFLRQLLRHRRRGKRMVVVVDNAGYHHARQLQPFLHRVRHLLTLLFLPPYSPQLAPIERVWKLARRLATHNHYFATLAQLVAAVVHCFHRWRKPNRVLHRLCCNI